MLDKMLDMLVMSYQTGYAGDEEDEDTPWLRYTPVDDNYLVTHPYPKVCLLEALVMFHQKNPDILHNAMLMLTPANRDAIVQFASAHDVSID